MKYAVGALLGLLALSGSALAQGAPSIAVGEPNGARRLEAVYSVTARGMNVGDFNFAFSQTGQAYEVQAERRASGFARTMLGSQQDYTYSARGSSPAPGVLRPSSYQHQGGRRHRTVRSTFTAEDITTTAEPRMGMGDPPATQAQKRGAIDQLSAIASMVVAQGDLCTRTIKVYMDGRSRFDFVMSPNGRVNVATNAYRGEAIRCSVQYRPISGFSDPQTPATLTFLFAPTQSGMYAPLRIEMPSEDAGVITLEARRLSVNGAGLR